MTDIANNLFTKMMLRKQFLSNLFKFILGQKDISGVVTLDHITDIGQGLLESGQSITMVVIGLDNFKEYNDCFGHLKANNILIEFGKRLFKRTNGLNSLVGKLGGDEFVVLFKNTFGETQENISTQIIELMENELYRIDSTTEPFKVPFSIGETTAFKGMNIHKTLQIAESNMKYNKFKNRSSARYGVSKIFAFQTQSSQLLKVLMEKDMYTYLHSQYVAEYSAGIAEELNLPSDVIQDIYFAGYLHDIGKITISNDILRKPYRLSDSEFSIIKKHVSNGLNILSGYDFSDTVKNAVLYHHERWDGKGYPNGIMGRDTPIEGRILQVADAVSAMTVKRVYRTQSSTEDALKEIKKHSGTQFDPEIVQAFTEIINNKKIAI